MFGRDDIFIFCRVLWQFCFSQFLQIWNIFDCNLNPPCPIDGQDVAPCTWYILFPHIERAIYQWRSADAVKLIFRLPAYLFLHLYKALRGVTGHLPIFLTIMKYIILANSPKALSFIVYTEKVENLVLGYGGSYTESFRSNQEISRIRLNVGLFFSI